MPTVFLVYVNNVVILVVLSVQVLQYVPNVFQDTYLEVLNADVVEDYMITMVHVL